MGISDIYSEIYEILEILGKDYVDRLPSKLYEHIKYKRNPNNTKEFYIDRPIEEQDLSIETLEFISFLNLHYWCTESEKIELLKIYNENDLKYEDKVLKKFDINFKPEEKNNNSNIINNIQSSSNIITYNNNNFFRKILNKLLNIIKSKE